MKILIYDKMIDATGAPDEIISPALSDIYEDDTSFDITFDAAEEVNCIGIGYTDADTVTITDGTTPYSVSITQDAPYHNGLYLLGGTLNAASYTISHNGSYIGRVGIGVCRTLGTNPTKEQGFYTTNESRQTLSGQVVPGAGGYSGRRLDADVRYKFDEDVYADLLAAYTKQISKNFPYFILNDDEQHKLPSTMLHFYGRDKDVELLLQSQTYKFLYSYKFQFYEAF